MSPTSATKVDGVRKVEGRIVPRLFVHPRTKIWMILGCLVLVGFARSRNAVLFAQEHTGANQSVQFLPVFRVPVPAFPEAEGFGANAMGGRGGRVIGVTNLNDSGPGSLRACVEADGPRVCIFRTGGTIILNSALMIRHPYLTIAGQTAPGDGITLRAANPTDQSGIYVKTYEVIIRYIRIRPGTVVTNSRALSINAGLDAPVDELAHNIVIDHVSMSWAGDEILIAWARTHDVTIQWSILAESLPAELSDSVGLKGPSLGNEYGGGPYSLHHNLLAHHTQRNPQISATGGPVDVVNNVIYNLGGAGSAVKEGARANFVGNYVKPGPNTRTRVFVDDIDAGGYYVSSNYIYPGRVTRFAPDNHVSPTRFPAPAVSTTTAVQAYEDVLADAGAIRGLNCDGSWFNRPDAVDIRIVQSVRDGTRGHDIPPSETFEQLGYISSPEDVGGWPSLAAGTPCPDSDQDGMSDIWEQNYFGTLSRGSATDSSGDFDGDGYTDLEEFLNGTNPTKG